MDRRDLHLSLVEDLLAAPGSERGWTAFLMNLADALGGSAASFISHDFTSAETGVSVTARTDPAALAGYLAHWKQHDPWATSPSTTRARAGTVVCGEELISQADLRRTAFYNDFGRAYGIVQCMAGIIEMSPRTVSVVSINRPATRPEFAREDGALLGALMPPLQRALDIHRRLSGAELLSQNANAVLDRLPHGVLLVGRNGAVLSTNREADSILQSHDGLWLDRGELRGSTIEVTTRLRIALHDAVHGGASSPRADFGMCLPRPSGKRPLSITIAPLPAARSALSSDQAVAVMFATDPEHVPLPQAATIQRLFGLTCAEARLAQCLAAGRSLEQSAEELGLRLETVRSRLKIIYQKTDTHRQGELVRLMLTSTSPALPI